MTSLVLTRPHLAIEEAVPLWLLAGCSGEHVHRCIVKHIRGGIKLVQVWLTRGHVGVEAIGGVHVGPVLTVDVVVLRRAQVGQAHHEFHLRWQLSREGGLLLLVLLLVEARARCGGCGGVLGQGVWRERVGVNLGDGRHGSVTVVVLRSKVRRQWRSHLLLLRLRRLRPLILIPRRRNVHLRRHVSGLLPSMREALRKQPIDVVVVPLVIRLLHVLAHGQSVGHPSLDPGVELRAVGLHVRGEHTEAAGQVFLFFLVHLLLSDDVLGDVESFAGALLVDFRGHAGGLDAGFNGAVLTTGGSNVGALLVLFVGTLGLGVSALDRCGIG